MKLQANSRHKETLLHCQRRGLTPQRREPSCLEEQGTFGNRPSILGGQMSALTIPPSPTIVLCSGIERGLGRV